MPTAATAETAAIAFRGIRRPRPVRPSASVWAVRAAVPARECRCCASVPLSSMLNASANSAAVRNRSAGALARAVKMMSSRSCEMVCRMMLGGDTASIVWRAMIAWGLGPVNGTCPTSISYSMQPRL